MRNNSNIKIERYCVIILMPYLFILTSILTVSAEINYELAYQDPAGDVIEFNETWSNKGTVDFQPQLDIKWLRSHDDPQGNITLRLEFKNNQIIEESNNTRYVFRIFTSQDNSTSYNITYMNGTCAISNFNGSFHEDMTSNTSIVQANGEILEVIVNKSRYLDNISYYNIDAYTWKEEESRTYIDYVSEIPGHPAETGEVIDNEQDNGKDQGLFDDVCSVPLIFFIVILVVIIIIIAVLWRHRY